jgi:5-methylcytosine-specific restriction endonuclease McrA
MKNLYPLRRKMFYWNRIVAAKNLANRTPLQALRPSVGQRITAYSQLTNPINLETIPASTYIAPNIGLLAGCYGKSDGMSYLKSKIINKQPMLLRGECQYCNIGEPNTFDHYLPKTEFPEYSALSINLIPCCATCNMEKGEEWLQEGHRRIINFYYDRLPNVIYLNCDIRFRNNDPVAVFTINAAAIPVNIRNVIVNHFDDLKLLERYQSRSNSEITDVYNTIVGFAGILNRAQVQAQLQLEAQTMMNSKGHNYWRAIIRLALSRSNRFLVLAGY